MNAPTCCGLELDDDWPDNYTPIEALAIVKALDEDGDVAVVAFASAGLNTWEAIGMTEHAKGRLLAALLGADRDD